MSPRNLGREWEACNAAESEVKARDGEQALKNWALKNWAFLLTPIVTIQSFTK
jgi:hypothetical protein